MNTNLGMTSEPLDARFEAYAWNKDHF